MKQIQTPYNNSEKESVLVVMPAYNEERKIENTLQGLRIIIDKIPGSEILIVNDGSTDETGSILAKLSKSYKFLKIINKKNEGHGKTIKRAYREAVKTKHKWIFQTDSDGHFDPKDFFKLWKRRYESNLILGYRHNRKDPVSRLFLSKIIQIYILIFLRFNIKDANIPFRLMENKYLKKTLSRLPKNVFAPNIFLSIIAAHEGQKLFNIKVKHKNNNYSHLNFNKIIKACFQDFKKLQSFKKMKTSDNRENNFH